MEPDVLVVGGGPAGSAVSTMLARQGYRVVLLERAIFPRDKACAEYLSPACTPILADLGVLESILAACPQRLQGMRITDIRGRSCLGHFRHHGQLLEGLALPRLLLDHLLLQHAQANGVEVRQGFWVRQPVLQGKRVRGVSGQWHGRQETVLGACVVAADGLHSTLGRRLGVVQRVRWLRHVALVTHYEGVQGLQGYGEMFVLPDGYIGLAPVGAQLCNVSLVVRQECCLAQRPGTLLTDTIQQHPELRHRFASARPVKPLLAIGPMAQRTICPHYDSIVFVGDAAGFFDPFTGQGIYLALHGAMLAAQAIVQALHTGDVSATFLRGYFRTHRRAFGAKYRLSEIIQLGLRSPWITARVIDRLARHEALADTVVGVAGDFLPPHAVLSWRFAAQVFL